MATVLKNILNFTGLVVGVPAVTPHLLNVNGTPKVPRIGGANVSGFTVTANATTVTVTRLPSAAAGAVRVYVEYWHTIEDVEPAGGIPSGYFPLFFAGDGGDGSGSDPAVIFDDAVPADRVNIRSNRASNQSPIDNTKVGVTNLGSQTNTLPASGAIANYATISGGDDNTASNLYAAVPGGAGNVASGFAATATGYRNTASGDFATVGGSECTAGPNSLAAGFQSTAAGYASCVVGDICSAGDNSACFGSTNVVGNSSLVGGTFNTVGNSGLCAGSRNTVAALGGFGYGRANTVTSTAIDGSACGVGARSIREGQRSHAVGQLDNAATADGSAQAWSTVFRRTLASVPNGSTIFLTTGGNANIDSVEMEDDHAYALTVSAIAYGTVAASPVAVAFKLLAACRCTGGIATVANVMTIDQTGDAAGASWTMTITGGISAGVEIDFDSGVTDIDDFRIVAKVDVTELIFT